LESQLPIPAFLIMAVMAATGGGMPKERLITYTLRYINNLNTPILGKKKHVWVASAEDLSSAIENLESGRFIFCCQESDIDILNIFFLGMVLNILLRMIDKLVVITPLIWVQVSEKESQKF
jgi:uncharacterized membrane protein YeiH